MTSVIKSHRFQCIFSNTLPVFCTVLSTMGFPRQCNPGNPFKQTYLDFLRAAVAPLVGASSHNQNCGFDPHSAHIPRLQDQCPVRACMGGNQSMYLSPIDVFLSLPLSKKSNVNIFASEDRKIASIPSEEVPEKVHRCHLRKRKGVWHPERDGTRASFVIYLLWAECW